MSSLPLPGLGRDVRRRLLIALVTFALAVGGTVTLDLAPAFATSHDYEITAADASALEGGNVTFTVTVERTSSAGNLVADETVTFHYTTVPSGSTSEGAGDCENGDDYLDKSGTGQVVFNPVTASGPERTTVTVSTCHDTTKEVGGEAFQLQLSDANATSTDTTERTAVFVGGTGDDSLVRVGTIVDDDPKLTVKLGTESVGATADFPEAQTSLTLEIAEADASPVTVTYALRPDSGTNVRPATLGSSCTAGVDVVPSGTPGRIDPGETTGILPIAICPDDRDEYPETFHLDLEIASGTGHAPAFFGDGALTKSVKVTIANDDDPKVIIGDASAPEGSAAMNENNKNNVMTFTLKLDRPSNEKVVVDLKTEPGTATAGANRTATGADYVTFADDVDIPVNTGTATVTVTLIGDDVTEGDETFMLTGVVTSNETSTAPARKNASVAGAGVGTILDDDKGPPAIGFPTPGTDVAGVESCDDHDQEDSSDPSDDVYAVCLDEGQDGQVTKFAFPVVLSHPSQSVVAVEYATADGTSTWNTGDYDKTEGTLQFEPGEIVKTITIDTNGDAFPGPNEHFFLRLSAPTAGTLRPAGTEDPDPTSARGVVLNDDGPVLESEDAVASEPENGGTSKATFALWLSEKSSQPVTVAYTTVSDTAKAGSDFTAAQGTATIPAGSLKTEVPVTILADDIVEGDETFFLQLSDAAGGTLRRAKLTGTIQDDGSTNRARALDLACPSNEVPSAGYTDVTGPTHELAIDCLAWWAITTGKGDGTYNPGGNVTRAQMASFIARAMTAAGVELPSDPPDHFRDDNGSPHELAINQLTELGVVTGKADGSYGAIERVGRGQTAALTARAYEVVTGAKLAAGDDAFRDDDRTTHEDDIDRVAAAGIVTGKADGKFDAGGSTTRAQMASIVMRLMDLLVEEEFAATPSSQASDDTSDDDTSDDGTSDDTSDDGTSDDTSDDGTSDDASDDASTT